MRSGVVLALLLIVAAVAAGFFLLRNANTLTANSTAVTEVPAEDVPAVTSENSLGAAAPAPPTAEERFVGRDLFEVPLGDMTALCTRTEPRTCFGGSIPEDCDGTCEGSGAYQCEFTCSGG